MAEDRKELVAIVAAREDELAPLRERVLVSEKIKDGPRYYLRGTLRGVQVVLAVTGDGKRNADLGIRRLIQMCAPTRVLAVGLGGALSTDLAVGDLVVSSEVMEGEHTLACPDLQWLEEASIHLDYDLGRLVTVDEILATPSSKSEWYGRTWRDQPAAADMESACFARVAVAYNLPYLIARAISDAADEVLPEFLEDCRAQDGSIDKRQVFWKTLWRPRSWGNIVRLRSRMRRCASTLADFAEGIGCCVSLAAFPSLGALPASAIDMPRGVKDTRNPMPSVRCAGLERGAPASCASPLPAPMPRCEYA